MNDPLGALPVRELLDLLEETRAFRPEELLVAQEVLEAAAERGSASGYRCRVEREGAAAAAFLCYGPTPCTQGTYDLYWIAVRPSAQGRGLARRLLAWALAEIRAEGGRLLVAETSGTPPYRPARRFYRAAGFRRAARIADFYRPGDDKLVFVLTLGPPPSEGQGD